MNDPVPLFVAILLLSACSCLALLAYSLRDFSRSRLEEICSRRSREQRFSAILKHYQSALLVTEVLLLICQLSFLGATLHWLGIDNQQSANPVQTLISGLAGAAAVLVLVRLFLPWLLARVAGERFLFHAWPLLTILMTIAEPLLALARWLDHLFHRLAGLEPPHVDDASLIADEILSAVDEGQREGILRAEARMMIHRVMELQEVDVADIMTPRTAMNCISVDATPEEVRRQFLEEGHSRVPVIGKGPDDIVGMLYAKDLLQHLQPNPNETRSLAEITREPFYVPETMGIDTLLKTFKRERVHLAIVLDEYGGVAGLVTMEDVLEEIVGEIVDEYDPAVSEPVRNVAPGVTDVDARLHIDDVNEKLDLELPSDRDFDTLGGFVFSLLGRIPNVGEQFQWEQLKFTVLEADKRRIIRIRIEQSQPESIPASSE